MKSEEVETEFSDRHTFMMVSNVFAIMENVDSTKFQNDLLIYKIDF